MSRNAPGQLINLNFENAPTFVAAQTVDNWIDGTATGSSTNDTYGWWASPRATAIAAQFDTAVVRNGSHSLKLSTTDTLGRVRAFSCIASGGSVVGSSANLPYWLPVVAGGTYTLTGWAQTNNVAAAGCFIEIVEINSAFAVGTSTGSNALSGTVSTWTQLSVTVTVGPTTHYIAIDCQNATAGNISDAWFDDLALTGPSSHASGFLNPRSLRPHPFSPGIAR